MSYESCFLIFDWANVKGDASARGTLIQQGGFSPSHPPACSAFRGVWDSRLSSKILQFRQTAIQ
jgi:hypothetical protein